MDINIKKQLSVLELADLAAIVERQESDLSLCGLTYEDRLNHLLCELVASRHNKLISKLIANADLKYPNASLATIDCEARGISRDKIASLASMGFVGAATNLIITGPTGAGKTYLACMLGVESCKQTFRTYYIRMPDMLAHFKTHKDNPREQIRYRKKLGNYKLLIIDEWLNYKIDEKESKFIYELIEHRCGNNPTVFVGQYASPDWHDRLGGGTVADSIMDRIIHNSYTIPTSDMNLRKMYDSRKVGKLLETL